MKEVIFEVIEVMCSASRTGFQAFSSELFVSAQFLCPANANRRKYVGAISNFVFNLAVRLRVLSPWEDTMSDLERGGSGHILGGNASNGRVEAERRR